MNCPRCDALARENAELREELEAWQGREDYWRRGEELGDRVARLRKALNMLGSGRRATAKLLLALIDRPGQLVSKERLLNIAAPDGSNLPDMKSVEIYVCYARKHLEAAGLGGAIETIAREGYRMAAYAARELRARMGEAA